MAEASRILGATLWIAFSVWHLISRSRLDRRLGSLDPPARVRPVWKWIAIEAAIGSALIEVWGLLDAASAGGLPQAGSADLSWVTIVPIIWTFTVWMDAKWIGCFFDPAKRLRWR